MLPIWILAAGILLSFSFVSEVDHWCYGLACIQLSLNGVDGRTLCRQVNFELVKSFLYGRSFVQLGVKKCGWRCLILWLSNAPLLDVQLRENVNLEYSNIALQNYYSMCSQHKSRLDKGIGL